LLVTLTSNIFIIQEREKSALEQQSTEWANTLAKLSIPYLIKDPKNGHSDLKKELKHTITADFINYIHVYSSKKSAPASFYAGFNKSVYYPSIPDKSSEISNLPKVSYHKNHLELIVRIEDKQQVYGYLYIQSDLKSINNFIDKIIYLAIFFYFFGIILSVFLALAIQKRISQPVSSMIESIQQVSQSKDYNLRLDKTSLIELDRLAHNINILLHRTQSHITKQDELHQQAMIENSNLTKKVTARTDALKASNQELLSTLEKLHQFQGQLVENEKMASLGDMVAGIAHEVNTPIGLGVTASSLLSDNLNEIKSAFEERTLKSSQLKRFLIQGQENISIIYRNLDRAAKLISSFKKLAVNQSTANTLQFNVKELLEEVLLTLKTKISEQHVTVTIECNEQLVVESKPGPLIQILINLIINSIIHGFEQQANGHIKISIMYLSQQLHINYQDDGIGLNENIKAKIFEPFTTTKRGTGGSGL
jgi:signal transduction histidine kinase